MMRARDLGLVLVMGLVAAACIAEPLDESPLNTYPPTSSIPSSATTTLARLPPTSQGEAIDVTTLAKDRPFAGRFRYDVYGPDSAVDVPVLILVHDLGGVAEITDLALSLAEQHIVIVPHYESPVRGGRFPDPLSVTACALAIATESEVYGGDPTNVTVLGVGFGALAGFIVANTTTLYFPAECEFAEMASPDRLVALGGSWSPESLASDSFDAMTTFMGGTPQQAPATWALLDPNQYIEPMDFEITLLRGAHDLDAAVTDTFAGHLLAGGWPVVVGIIAGHTSRSALTGAQPKIASYVDS
jgi:hypothetical protein